ncbi:hypothetical protein [Hymenobacter cellulosilyticus]|uniref:Uncharacterized protein n=1 Tax=Hymenobacter cellulosilyticus TaxID=2932248 RepID=A0A8T9Q0L1_9BACT|nr:hypothetical protein [Hymenobacter cellulosilyticus]UOQ70964.1 hypothetical protein MUN79_20135 [Hymenobacter cellulosilyticus]
MYPFLPALCGCCMAFVCGSLPARCQSVRKLSDLQNVSSAMGFGYEQRLEAQLPYQQALLPLKPSYLSSYWIEWSESYSSVTGDARKEGARLGYEGLLKEFTVMHYLNHLQRSWFDCHDQVAPTTRFEGKGLPIGATHLYTGKCFTTQGPSQPDSVVLYKNFDPLRVVEGYPPPQPAAACFFYVLDIRPGFIGDTLASYRLEQAQAGGTYHLVFQVRDEQKHHRTQVALIPRRWRGQVRTVQWWDYDPTGRRLTSARQPEGFGSGFGSRWTRTYGAGQDYVEVLEETELLDEHGGGTKTDTWYERRHTCSYGRVHDQYTVHLPNSYSMFEPGETVTMTIVTDFR